MKKPTQDGLALAESLYGPGQGPDTDSKVTSPPEKTNKAKSFGRPSLIPGVKYPLTDKEERLLDLAWKHFKDLESRGIA